mmetsp:Transcript_2220/g.9612  ORF Transcript_2220/g.9612 Transcript_2220/m.9612 type:complete len:228 (+) Transcript_2220:2477-3160(+)
MLAPGIDRDVSGTSATLLFLLLSPREPAGDERFLPDAFDVFADVFEVDFFALLAFFFSPLAPLIMRSLRLFLSLGVGFSSHATNRSTSISLVGLRPKDCEPRSMSAMSMTIWRSATPSLAAFAFSASRPSSSFPSWKITPQNFPRFALNSRFLPTPRHSMCSILRCGSLKVTSRMFAITLGISLSGVPRPSGMLRSLGSVSSYEANLDTFFLLRPPTPSSCSSASPL